MRKILETSNINRTQPYDWDRKVDLEKNAMIKLVSNKRKLAGCSPDSI